MIIDDNVETNDLELLSEPASRLSAMADGLIGSEILKIASDIRGLVAAGHSVCNLTVGDFSPAQFRIPMELEDAIVERIRAGETNYPPSDGVAPLRRAVVEFYQRRLGLCYPVESVLVTGGSRPGIYAAYRAVVDAGDRVVYPVPSWNNNHYCHLVGAVGVPVTCSSSSNFLPTGKQLREALRGARLLALNSPLNPTGTAFTPEQLADVCDAVLEENARRSPHERPLYLMYDQVYWMLTFGGVSHVNPVTLRPAMQPFTIFVDGISKAFAATGVRVGWTVGPEDITHRMASFIGHVGAWAPRAEQLATATLLADDSAMDQFHATMRPGVETRLQALFDGMESLRSDGLPVQAIAPMGAIYLSVRFPINGMQTPDETTLATNEQIRHYLLQESGIAIVPFQAFGMVEDSGWFRLSVGAVSIQEIAAMLPRLRQALAALR